MGKMNNKSVELLVVCACAAFFAGCAQPYRVEVTSTSSDAAMAKKDYALAAGTEDAQEEDVRFKEYAGYVHRTLQGKGFNQVERESAELIVLISYGIREPRTHYYTETHPAVSRAMWRQSLYGPYRWEARIDSYTSYTRYLIIAAYEAGSFRESEGKELVEVWKTTAESTGASDDLRRVMPVMVAAACEYVGTETKKKVDITLREDDRKVKFIKGEE